MRVCTELKWPGLVSPKWDGFSYSFVHLGAPSPLLFECLHKHFKYAGQTGRTIRP